MEQMPVFVKISETANLRSMVSSLRQSILEAKTILGRIQDLSSEESLKASVWKSNFEFVKEKTSSISSTMLEPERL